MNQFFLQSGTFDAYMRGGTLRIFGQFTGADAIYCDLNAEAADRLANAPQRGLVRLTGILQSFDGPIIIGNCDYTRL